MSLLAWIIVGFIAGWLAEMIFPGAEPRGTLGTLLIGVLGAVVGGWLFNAFGKAGATGVDLYSLLVATLGAGVCLSIYRVLTGRRLA